MKAMESASGQRWARFGLGFGASLSVLGNVAHTVLANSSVSLWLRVPFAVVWPVALFIGIEVLVRVNWRAGMVDWMGRVLLVGPVSAVAAIVSWLHLHHLMTMADETTVASVIGPFAVDGLMLGSTVALLAIRAARLAVPQDLEPVPVAPAEGFTMTAAKPDVIPQDIPTVVLEAPKRERAPRATSDTAADAVRLLLAGEPVAAVVEKSNLSRGTVGRYNTVINKLRALGPDAELGKTPGVGPDLMLIIRDAVRRERAL